MPDTLQDHNYMINDLGVKQGEFFPGKATACRTEGSRFFFDCDNGACMMVHFVTDRIVRVRFATDRFDNDFSYAIDPEFEPGPMPQVDLEEREKEFVLTGREVVVQISRIQLKTRFLDREGRVLNEDEKGFHWEENREYGGDIVQMSKKLQPRERFFGLGDKTGRLDLRGRRYQLWGSDTYAYGNESDPLYKNIPFYVGAHQGGTYGIFFDNSFRSFFDFGQERSNVSSFWAQGGEMNYYFFHGSTMQEVTEAYAHLTGRPKMPPVWALGYHQCRWSYETEEKVWEIADRFRELSIPCDAIYLDIDYMDGFRCFTWNRENFPEPKAMVGRLREKGFRTVVIIDPGIKIDPDYSVFQEGLERGYFCRRGDGPLMKGSVWPGLCYFPDFTRAEVREWWAGLFKDLVEEVGVRGVWNDMNEPAVFEEGTFPRDVRHDYDGHSCSHRRGHNVYGMQMARATEEGVKRFSGDERPFAITRSGYAGVQRYACGWTGDNIASWEHLRIANIQCQRLSLSGMSFIGSDIGGFIETPDGELYVRWLQLGIFHPFCRTHSSQDYGSQEPWSFGEPFTSLARGVIEMRYRLLPYLYTAFWQHVRKGTPILRSLPLIDHEDPEMLHREEEFGVGDSLLVCPVSKAGVDGRWLYLPQGRWFDFWTGKSEKGGTEVWADAPIERFPFYVREGTVLPLAPVRQHVGAGRLSVNEWRVYCGVGTFESVLYEDGGDGYGDQEGQFLEKRFVIKGSVNEVELRQIVTGQYEEPYDTIDEVKIMGLPFAAIEAEARIDGQPVEGRVDGDMLVLSGVPKRVESLVVRRQTI
ncbi:MAG: glycoside hydrolase family 31 protein [Verrucomicrobiota bacterium]